MADLVEILDAAAARPTGPPPVDDIARQAARRRRTRRALAGAAVVVVLALVGVAAVARDDGESDESVEYVGDPPNATAAAWTELAGLTPSEGWTRPVTFGSDGTLVLGSYFGGRNPDELAAGLRGAFGIAATDVAHGVVTQTPPEDVLIASGTFDLAAVDSAVRADPDWSDLLTMKEWEGESFYSWGGDYTIERDPTPLRPLGRGGRLLVRDDLFVFTRGDAEMHEIIEKLVAGSAPPDERFDDVARAAADRSMVSMTYLGPGHEWPGVESPGPDSPAIAIADDSDGTETDTGEVREALLLGFATPEEAEQAVPLVERALAKLVTPGVEVARNGPVVELVTTGRNFWQLPQGDDRSALQLLIDATAD